MGFARLIIAVALAAVSCLGQSSSGGGAMLGFVKDASGALIPKAKIIIQHVQTGVITNTTTNSEGFFSTPSLNIGKYKVRIEAIGMRPWETELQLETGRTAEVNAVMSLGQVNETVEVTATVAPLVSTTDATEGSTLDSMRIQELPINGRDLHMLIQDVSPGVEANEDVNAGLRVSGLMVYSTDFVQDGASSNNREFGGSMNLQGLESVAEVRVETSTSSAKYNRPTSVIVTTRGGTNQIRGAVYETARNNGFGVARARQDRNYDGTPYKTPKLIRNEFGGSIGGPLILPSFGVNGRKWYNGRGRTFFFVSREAQELRQAVTMDFTVPTPEMRRGDFSGLYDAQGRYLTLYDPLTTAKTTNPNGRVVAVRQRFPGNQLPLDRQSPIAKFIYGITPMPTDITNPVVTSNLRIPVPRNSYPNSSSSPTAVRVDHKVSDNDNLFLKANWSSRSMNFLGTASGIGAPTTGFEANMTYLPMDAISGGFTWNHMFSTRFFVETLLNRTWQSTKTVNGPVQKNWAEELGLPNPFQEIGWPAIKNVSFMTYLEGDNRRMLYSMVTNAEQNYSLIRATHTIQFGWRWHHEKQNLQPDQGDISGTQNYNSMATALENPSSSATNPTAQSQTGYDAANFFLGYAARIDVGLKRKLLRIVDRNYGLYLQDNWRVNGRLTLTPGVRWDINPAMFDKDYLLNAFDMPTHSIMLPQPLEYYYKKGVTTPAVVANYEKVGVQFKTAQELGRSKQIFPSNDFDIGPRMGVAYRLFGGRKQTVLRGGYGIYLSPIAMRTLLAQFSSMAPFRGTFSYNPNSSAQSPDSINNWLLRNVPAVIAGVNSATLDLDNPTAIGRGVAVRGMDRNQPNMKVYEWNMALERQLNSSTVVRVRYTGKHGVNADQLQEYNSQANDYIWYTTQLSPTPSGAYSSVARRPYDKNAYTEVRILQRTGYINSSVVSFEMERRFTKGLGFQGFYTITNAFRMAGNSFRDDVGSLPSNFLPDAAVPADLAKLNRLLFYDRDTGVPKHRIRWNWNYELPFGKGKALGRNAPDWLNQVVGGWKFSGSGTILSQYFSMPTGDWGEMSGFKVYGREYKILDCRGTPAAATTARDERCLPGYLYFNGYISQRYINSYNAAGLRNGVFGLPSDYVPAQKPVNPWPQGGQPGAPGSGDWDTDYVYIRLNNNANQRVAYDTGLHPWRNQHVLGPFNWSTDASLMKFFRVTERFRLRANIDVFNVLNTQGLVNPASDGIATLATSYGGNGIRPRQLQVTMRLEW